MLRLKYRFQKGNKNLQIDFGNAFEVVAINSPYYDTYVRNWQ